VTDRTRRTISRSNVSSTPTCSLMIAKRATRLHAGTRQRWLGDRFMPGSIGHQPPYWPVTLFSFPRS
jgi:hypothetical protein